MILAALYAIAQLVVSVGCVIAWLLSPEPSREELERASMRASSWPTVEDKQWSDLRSSAK